MLQPIHLNREDSVKKILSLRIILRVSRSNYSQALMKKPIVGRVSLNLIEQLSRRDVRIPLVEALQGLQFMIVPRMIAK
jgi:hypothetical protein